MVKSEFKTDKSGLKYAQILGVRINITLEREVLNTISNFLVHGHKFCLFSTNPELLVMAASDVALKKIINQADLAIPDGVGLKVAVPKLPIIKGRQLFLALTALAKKEKWRTFFLGGLGISGVVAGPRLNRVGEPASPAERTIQAKLIAKINRAKPDLLFVGFGMPKQEYWIARNLPKLKIGGVMAVGGTFDYLYGKAKLPPKWLERLGLEWLWRLIREPWRAGRAFNAAVVFPLKIFWHRVRQRRV